MRALFARNPDAKWVAPPGRSLHRLGTELDLGPPAAYAWPAANGEPFHLTQRYSWLALDRSARLGQECLMSRRSSGTRTLG
jgi:hypothetical protein